MTYVGTNGTSLAQLRAPRRNRYFYGKLLDVLHLTMEQQYGIAASAHVNRLNFGPGVFCGLGVTGINRDDGHGVRVESGVAFDALGRRIVVPDAVELLPLQLTDDCGLPAQPPADGLPPSLVLSICYRECEADFAPALVPDPACNGSTRCEAGTWVESYSLIVREGEATAVSHVCRDEVIAKLKAGDIQAALCALAVECPDMPADTCVPLATITVGADGSLTIPDPCAVRPVVPTNRALLELITCLAQRIEECCGSTPGSTSRIEDLAVGNRGFTTYHKLTETPAGISVPATEEPAVIVITFSDDIDESSVALGTNVVITDANGSQPTFDPPIFPDGRSMRLELSSGIFEPGAYSVEISGDPPSPIMSKDGTELDAEFTQLPTGDASPGGVFRTTFTVTN